MKCYYKGFFFVLLTLGIAVFPESLRARTLTGAVQEEAAQEETAYSEEEYNAYMSAANEPDYGKRGDMLLAFIKEYPKSTLMTYINAAYTQLLFTCEQEKKYEQLEPLAEKWLKLHPGDMQTMAYIVAAAGQLGHNQKCVDYLEQIYKLQPTGNYAKAIADLHKKLGNDAEYIEWTEKLLEYPEYEANYGLRFELMQKYLKDGDMAKAAEYARLTLKSAALVKSDDPAVQEHLHKVKHVSYDLIGKIQYEEGDYKNAIKSFQQALGLEKYCEGYYYIGMILWKQESIEEAMIYFAAAELQGGTSETKAKEHLEALYKSLHNDTTIGINKVYNKAKDLMEKKSREVLSAQDIR
jgi:tetratricopeptide (TPR) repeat protein